MKVILLWLQLVGITQINGGNSGTGKTKEKIDCARVKSSCESDLFEIRCTGEQTPCCGPKGRHYKSNKRDCPNEMKALETSCKKNTFEGLENKVQVNGRSLPCKCAPFVCDAEIGKIIYKRKKGKGPNHLDITEGPCCDTKSEFYDKCPKEMKTYEKRGLYSCKMVFVDKWWRRCNSLNCAFWLDYYRNYSTKGVPKRIQESNAAAYDEWKSLCCQKSMLHEQCPTEMASFNDADGSCD